MDLPANFKPGEQLIIQYLGSGAAPAPAPGGGILLPGFGPTYQPPAIGGLMFPPTHPYYQPIDTAPVHALSETWKTAVGPTAPLHPDFAVSSYGAGYPLNVMPAGTKLIPVTLAYQSASDPGPWPIYSGAVVDVFGDPTQSDPHLFVWDQGGKKLYEMYHLIRNADFSFAGKASSGVVWDLTTIPAKPAGFTAANAAGLPMIPFLARYEEASAGIIPHALLFTAKPTGTGYIAPATHASGAGATTANPPMGSRWRLKSSFVIPATVAPIVANVLQTLQKYGMTLYDNGTTGYLSGIPDTRWDDLVMHTLNVAHISDFEIVDLGLPITPQ
jgi:hypothetical protein